MKTVTFKNKDIDVSATIRFPKDFDENKNMQRLYAPTQLVAVKNKLPAQSMVKNLLKLGLLL